MRPGRRLAWTVLVAAAVVGGVIVPLAAPAEVSARSALASGSRFIVTWGPAASGPLRIAGVATATLGVSGRRSLVVALPGRATAVASGLRSTPGVLSVVPDALVHIDGWPTAAPNDTYYASGQADLRLIGVPAAWKTTTGSAAVVVAVLDTGMMRTHTDLDGVAVTTPWNFLTDTANVSDGNGHGTHVIGTIAAETNNGIGVAGIAPRVTIMPIKVLDDAGHGYISDVLDGIDYARVHGAQVISMSLGGTLTAHDATALQPVVDAAYNAGITIVAAAGNDGNGTVSYPGAFRHVLSIAATDDFDRHASFSNANSTVDLAAPGVGTVSTYRTGGYASMSGTSMATPHVAAVAALVRSAHPGATVDQVETALRATAVDLGARGRDNLYGSGRVNAAGAVGWPFRTRIPMTPQVSSPR
ncbi:MAG TPA: S8 family peptidase [Candidatus Limnocylindrales bacterium]